MEKMKTPKYKIADLEGKTLQVNQGCHGTFNTIDKVTFSDIPGRDVDIHSGEDVISLTADELLDIMEKGHARVTRQGIALADLFII